MKKRLFVLVRLGIVLICVANTQWHFASGGLETLLYVLTLAVIAYEVLDSHRKIQAHRKTNRHH